MMTRTPEFKPNPESSQRMFFRPALGALALFVLAVALYGCAKGGGKAKGADQLFANAQQLQQEEKFNDAVKVYRQIAEKYPKSRQGANSQFMVGYIYANHLKDLEQARIELNRFLDKFSAVSDSGLIAGAKFELQFLGKDISEIPTLSGLEQGDSTGEKGESDTGKTQ